MRIKRLDLRAFGPFTGHKLDFSSQSPGLHIVYGVNEAGKSSCLRALHSFFFGIPARTSDDFIHPYNQLLIGGCLYQEGGRELTFFRRKKRTADLFDENDNPIDPMLLSPFLQGMEQEIFESLYGIDHEALVRGGQDILDQKGDVGQAIFAAGAGLTSLHKVFEELEKEGDDLFRPRASTKAVNEALSQYHEIQTQMKQSFLSSREWEDHRRALQTAERGLEDARELRKEKDREKSRLERLQRALPYIGQHKMYLGKIADLGEVILLPPDFREQRRKLEQERHDTQNRLETANTRMNEIQKRKKEVSLQKNLLNRANDIEEMYQRLGEYRKAMTDRPGLEGMGISCKNAAADLLKRVRPDMPLDQAETLRSSLSKRRTILNLGNRYEALVQQIEQSGREIKKLETSLIKAQEEFSTIPPARNVQDLIQTVKPAQRAGDLDEELMERQRVMKAGLEDCRDELSRLGLWNGRLDQVGRLAVPIPETVNRFEEELNFIHDRRKQIQKEKEGLEKELRQLFIQIQEIQHAGEVPEEKDLARIRSRRDSGWRLIRRQWIEGEDLAEEITRFSPEASLPDTYEGLIENADKIADRLRREADRVQKYASLKSRINNLENRLSELDMESKDLESAFSEVDRAWHETWAPCDIIPLSPREMRQWISGFEKVRFKSAEAEKASAETKEKEKQRRELRDKLIEELRKGGDKPEFTGPELAPVLLYAETLLDSVKTQQTKREKLENKMDEFQQALGIARNERDKAEEKLDQWRARWSDALMPLGLDRNTIPDEVTDFIDSLQSCLDKLAEAEDFRKRIDGIDRDNQN
ncbi:MAG: AAA family ATPase, partial [Deltaproteobacteria bacterium]|nr:AAA family ATPase [Deltaproteobacteria bacterium]